mmetsp:Transcript_33791/g.46795  ORF Transcript_33791/g.46795 Transcript_33791/m.46795 type:complete len:448 (-) Transcript_33791:317-1660(-)|eukprot:CAMPEP_0196579068 /NCGR_PEP_ID=MMETSP1081-20130531/17434_1 /TAXON_ID=36882 /ORGANISM="Pyramimonas amylifera, Strain CCMP720" /LENGTH=447 /DNA_ID=CAMNT_0041898517 /DNA_START=115 /DNA_END=1458 /DNA_ORIENTATION=+
MDTRVAFSSVRVASRKVVAQQTQKSSTRTKALAPHSRSWVGLGARTGAFLHGSSSSSAFRSFSKSAPPANRRAASLVVNAGQDFYTVLGVSRGSDQKEIKRAYRQLARKFHPDVNKAADADAKFKEISNAYEVLSDDQKRSIYDRYGEAGLKGASGFPGGGGSPGDFTNPFDLFETFFGSGMGGSAGGARQRNRPQQGDDERYDLSLSFLEAVFGCEKELETVRLEACGTCTGSGVKGGTKPETCSTCGGAGQTITTARTPLGNFQQVSTCGTCGGSGQLSQPCQTCGGDGRVRRSKKISLRVPAGVDNGSRLRVRAEGNAGRQGGPQGDLYVFITVRQDADLVREGVNINSEVSISYTDAILGTNVQVNTVDGPVDLKIPAGVQPGTVLLMAKRGVPRLGNPTLRGDQLVTVNVTIPQRLSKDERKLVEDLASLSSGSRSGGKSWL